MNPDEVHLKEYAAYLKRLNNNEENLPEAVRLFRIDSVKNAIKNIQEKIENDKKSIPIAKQYT